MIHAFQPADAAATVRGVAEPGARWVDASEAEYSEFFRVEFAAVVRTAYLIVHDQHAAEDLAQEAFTRLLLNWQKIARYERPDAWVRRIAIRLAVRFARRERMREVLLRWVEPPRPVRSSDLDLARAIRALPPRQRAAIALHYYEDRPLTEIADLLGCSHSTAKVHLFKARRRLATLLGEDHRETDHVA
jgi:RNA polymerase sigma-70 factor (ECF subfamily)